MNPVRRDISTIDAGWTKSPELHRFEHNAMATVYEIYIHHENRTYAEQAALDAFNEIDRLEDELSRFRPNSDVSRINALKPEETIIIGPDAFECLRHCQQLYADTGGVFDVTVGVLMDCWLKKDKLLRQPEPEELEKARRRMGIDHFQLDEETFEITLVHDEPVGLDFGGYGKGYALDRVAELLEEWEIRRALIHGGSSSILALDAPPDSDGWPVTISDPGDRSKILADINLKNCAVSGSGLEKGQHVLDPRTGWPLSGKPGAWAMTKNAAGSDALSTAFLIMLVSEVEAFCRRNPETRALLALENARTARFGI